MRQTKRENNNRKGIQFLVTGLIGLMGIIGCSAMCDMRKVCATGQTQTATESVQYQYDALGRVTRADYKDGTYIEFVYDKNGNIIDMIKSNPTTDTNIEQGNTNTGSENGTHGGGDNGTAGESNTGGTDTGDSDNPKDESEGGSALHSTAEDVKQYNLFKKKKPVIKSIKQTKKKSKRYITIKIKQVKKKGAYSEAGYQIKYATNSKFKKAKTVTVTRHKKNKFTTKKWKVKKNKTYYVKVRAYMMTKEGKKIYTKYSKVKKIKVK